MKTLEKDLKLIQRLAELEVGNKTKSYIVTSSKLIFQKEDHSITQFETITNGLKCHVTVNCGLTPPQIFFEFNDYTEDIEIDHDYQTDVIDTLISFEKTMANSR